MLYKYCEELSSQSKAETEGPVIGHFITLNLSSDWLTDQLLLQLHKEVGERRTTFRSFVCI